MYDPITNLAVSTVATAPSPATSGTTIVLATGHGSRFPDPSTDGAFNLIISPASGMPDPSNTEIIRCTARSGDTLTVTRAQEGTTARTIVAGDYVKLGVTKKTITDIQGYAISKTLVDAKGDILTATADNTPARLAVGTDGQKLVADSSETTGLKWVDDFGPYHSMARQAIMNGNFDIWQRNTGFSAAGKTADRWQEWNNGAGGTLPAFSFSRIALTPGDIDGAFYGYRSYWNGVGSSLGNDAEQITYTRIEHGTRFLAGKGNKVTLSFWAKSDISNKRIGVRLSQNYGTGGSPSSQEWNTGYTITLSSNWTKYTITFTLTSIVGKTFGTNNDDYLELAIQKMWGSNLISRYNSGTAEGFRSVGSVDIAQVQLNAGEIALPFQPKSFEQELQDCMRYFETSYSYGIVVPTNSVGLGEKCSNASATFGTIANLQTVANVHYKVPKRTAVIPTIYPITTATNTGRISSNDGTDQAAGSGTAYMPTTHNFCVYNNSGGSMTIQFNQVYFNWSADAEL